MILCCPVLTYTFISSVTLDWTFYIQVACVSKHCDFFRGFHSDSGITALHTVHLYLYLQIYIHLSFWTFVIFTWKLEWNFTAVPFDYYFTCFGGIFCKACRLLLYISRTFFFQFGVFIWSMFFSVIKRFVKLKLLYRPS